MILPDGQLAFISTFLYTVYMFCINEHLKILTLVWDRIEHMNFDIGKINLQNICVFFDKNDKEINRYQWLSAIVW